jgi:hypothetical protein
MSYFVVQSNSSFSVGRAARREADGDAAVAVVLLWTNEGLPLTPLAKNVADCGLDVRAPSGEEHPGQRDEAWFKARDRAEARRVLAQGDRQGDGSIAHSLLTDPGGREGAASAALGRLARTRKPVDARSAGEAQGHGERSWSSIRSLVEE